MTDRADVFKGGLSGRWIKKESRSQKGKFYYFNPAEKVSLWSAAEVFAYERALNRTVRTSTGGEEEPKRDESDNAASKRSKSSASVSASKSTVSETVNAKRKQLTSFGPIVSAAANTKPSIIPAEREPIAFRVPVRAKRQLKPATCTAAGQSNTISSVLSSTNRKADKSGPIAGKLKRPLDDTGPLQERPIFVARRQRSPKKAAQCSSIASTERSGDGCDAVKRGTDIDNRVSSSKSKCGTAEGNRKGFGSTLPAVQKPAMVPRKVTGITRPFVDYRSFNKGVGASPQGSITDSHLTNKNVQRNVVPAVHKPALATNVRHSVESRIGECTGLVPQAPAIESKGKKKKRKKACVAESPLTYSGVKSEMVSRTRCDRNSAQVERQAADSSSSATRGSSAPDPATVAGSVPRSNALRLLMAIAPPIDDSPRLQEDSNRVVCGPQTSAAAVSLQHVPSHVDRSAEFQGKSDLVCREPIPSGSCRAVVSDKCPQLQNTRLPGLQDDPSGDMRPSHISRAVVSREHSQSHSVRPEGYRYSDSVLLEVSRATTDSTVGCEHPRPLAARPAERASYGSVLYRGPQSLGSGRGAVEKHHHPESAATPPSDPAVVSVFARSHSPPDELEMMDFESGMQDSQTVVDHITSLRSQTEAAPSYEHTPSSGLMVADQQPQKPLSGLSLVIDTNVLINSVDFVGDLRAAVIEGVRPVLLIPWVVLQELDGLKSGGRGSSSGKFTAVMTSARTAISFLLGCFQAADPHIRGQTAQEAKRARSQFDSSLPDDEILKCCLASSGRAFLLSEDKNLLTKSLVHGVRAFTCRQLLQKTLLCDIQTALPFCEVESQYSTRLLLRCLLSHLVVRELQAQCGAGWRQDLVDTGCVYISMRLLVCIIRKRRADVFNQVFGRCWQDWVQLLKVAVKWVWSDEETDQVVAGLVHLSPQLRPLEHYRPLVEPLLAVVRGQTPLSRQTTEQLLPSIRLLFGVSASHARKNRVSTPGQLVRPVVSPVTVSPATVECRAAIPPHLTIAERPVSEAAASPASSRSISPLMFPDYQSETVQRPSAARCASERPAQHSPVDGPAPCDAAADWCDDVVMGEHSPPDPQDQTLQLFNHLWSYINTCCGVLLDCAGVQHCRTYEPPPSLPSHEQCQHFLPAIAGTTAQLLRALKRLMLVSVVSLVDNDQLLTGCTTAMDAVISQAGSSSTLSTDGLLRFIKHPQHRLLLTNAVGQLVEMNSILSSLSERL